MTVRMRQARLALEDGTIVRGRAFGAFDVLSTGEVVFNTAMCGYQESLTDPSYTGQILVATFPLIGNYGVNPEDVESAKVQVAGYLVRELSRAPSNARATMGLDAYLAAAGVLGIEGIPTRELTRRLRSGGVMRGAMTDREGLTDAALIMSAKSSPRMDGCNLVPLVGCSNPTGWTETLGEWSPGTARADGEPLRVLALDCGAKRNILRNLADRGCEVEVVPHTVSPGEVLDRYTRGTIDGLFVSNGPGDPAAVEGVISMLRSVIAANTPMPIFGICLGHQLLALALGARTFKLKFGHRGVNQPVHNKVSGRVEITSQNHGFAVDPGSLETGGGEPTHVNLNDGTLAGFRVKGRPIFAVQHHPEAAPGPHDAGSAFDTFVRAMDEARAARV